MASILPTEKFVAVVEIPHVMSPEEGLKVAVASKVEKNNEK